MKYLSILGICALLTGCGSTGGSGAAVSGGTIPTAEAWKKVPGVTNVVKGRREVMKATVNGKDVVAVLTWRDYSATLDGALTKWYGDMASPPPKFVVESLTISIDGRGTIVPQSKTRYLGSQWMNDVEHLGIYLKGKNPCVYVNLGDGGESWAASYVVNLSTGALVSHAVEDGPEFHNAADPT